MSLLCISQVTAGSAVQACLTTAMDNLAAAPASLRKAPRATFCFAWHTDAPADKLLEWLQVNVQWAARALQWSDSYQLHSSAPENDADMPLPTASVVLASATLLAESEEYSAAESSISEVCLCICRHNHLLYNLRCAGRWGSRSCTFSASFAVPSIIPTWYTCTLNLFMQSSCRLQDPCPQSCRLSLLTCMWACCQMHRMRCMSRLSGSVLLQVLSEEFKSPVECYVTCPGPLPLFQGSLTTLTASGTEHATQLLRQHGVVVLPVRCYSSHTRTCDHACMHTGRLTDLPKPTTLRLLMLPCDT